MEERGPVAVSVLKGAWLAALAIAALLISALALPTAADAKPHGTPAGHVHPLTYGSGDDANPYLVYIPAGYKRSDPAPLLVMTHGCQTTARQQMRANLYNRLADRKGFIVVYPDVDDAEVAQPGPLSRCWQFFNSESWHRGSGDAADIAGITRAVIDRWRVDRQRVYMVGMSAGSFMTSIMAAAYPDLFAAVGINAGGAYGDPSCLFVGPGIPAQTSAQMAYGEMGSRARVVPRLVMGGDADQGVPPACADKALEQGLRTNNLALGDSQTAPIPLAPSASREVANPGGYGSTVKTYRDPDGCLIGQRWLIHGMNHFWPGGSSDPQWASFTDPKGPSGAEISWRFLSPLHETLDGDALRRGPLSESPALAVRPLAVRPLAGRRLKAGPPTVDGVSGADFRPRNADVRDARG